MLGALVACVAGYGLYRWAVNDLPSFSKIADYKPAQVTTVLARDGSLIGQLYREKRYVIGIGYIKVVNDVNNTWISHFD